MGLKGKFCAASLLLLLLLLILTFVLTRRNSDTHLKPSSKIEQDSSFNEDQTEREDKPLIGKKKPAPMTDLREKRTVKNPDETVFDADIRVNHPLMHNGFTIYQSSYGLSEWARPYPAGDDTALVEVTLTGTPDEMPPVATFDMVMDEYYFIPGFGDSIKISLAELHRDFERIQSVSGEPNPAVKINVIVHNKIRFIERQPGILNIYFSFM